MGSSTILYISRNVFGVIKSTLREGRVR